ncbi:MAG: hypothetical protein QMD12_00785 [Candidatus Aenigmarchaeota archaeon]|nr:hypothetical protein [Candidatus Aenigmarchaeota archaeon]
MGLRKGIIYSITSILFIIAISVVIIIYNSLSRSLGSDVSDKVVSDMINQFKKNAEADLEKAITIVGKRAILSAVNYTTTSGNALDDSVARLKELMENGTLYGDVSTFMLNNTIYNWTRRIQDIASATGFELSLNISPVEVRPYDSFNLIFKTNLTINISEKTGYVRIDRFVEKSVIVSIENFEDPLTALKTNGLYIKKIVRCPYENNHTFQVDSTWNLQNLEDDIQNGYYHPSVQGASFLDRLEGSLTTTAKYQNLAPGKTIGLEHFVNLQTLYDLGIPINTNKTVVDHLYWDSNTYTSYRVNGLTIDWFRIDNETDGYLTHAQIYGVEQLLI